MNMVKKWWYYILILLITVGTLISLDGKKELSPYKDYIFYGIAQNKVTSKLLKVNFTIKGFPITRHSMYVEIIKPDGEIDFLYSEEHTKNHRAHYHKESGVRKYKASYNIPYDKLPKGNYKLRVTFEFDSPGWGRLNRDVIVSNDVKFEIK